MRIEWNASVQVGHPQVDSEHKQIVDMYNKLVDERASGAEVDLGESLIFLANYVKTHFDSEEGLMTEAGYPGHGDHHAAHDALLADVEHRVQAFLSGEDADVDELVSFLRDWLINHIQGHDAAFVGWLQEHGATVAT